VGAVLAGALVVALVATLGSVLSPHVPQAHRMAYQLTFFAIWFVTMGGAIGAASGRVIRGLMAGLAAGLVASLTLVGAALVVRHIAGTPQAPGGRRLLGVVIFAAVWLILWCMLSLFNSRVLRRQQRSWREGIVRGVLAGVLSSAAVVLISAERSDDVRRNTTLRYVYTFVGWTLASGAGLAAVIGGQAAKERR